MYETGNFNGSKTDITNSEYFRDYRADKPKQSKKVKKLSKLINNSDSETGNESEHELSYYMEDRVKLMKEVLKVIKPKKIKTMAPDCIKKMQIEEINSMLLEELLGISKKRLQYIFEGKSLDEESSTDEDQPLDVISLDDVSEDDFVIISDEETQTNSKKNKRKKIKDEPKEKSKKIKKEKPDKQKGKEKNKDKGKEKQKTTSKYKEPIGEENLMSVLELLELQARARAIRSQLDLECKKKKEEQERIDQEKGLENGQDDDEEIIIEVPKEVEIVITSSDSDNDEVINSERSITTSTTTNGDNSKTSTNNNINENTNNSQVQINESTRGDNIISLQINKNGKTNKEKSVKINRTCTDKTAEGANNIEGQKYSNSDKEEGEVSDVEITKKRKSAGEVPALTHGEEKLDGNSEEKKIINEDISRGSSNSGFSDSDDNLQMVMLREKRKRSVRTNKCKNKVAESLESQSESPKNLEKNKSLNEDISTVKRNQDEQQLHVDQNNESSTNNVELPSEDVGNETETNVTLPQSGSKIKTAIEEFIKTQPPPHDKTEELKKLEKEAQSNEAEAKQSREKRLKNLKNKLQSYKKDVEGESSVTILENIVIKPKAVGSDITRQRVAEDHDDLVINVDQDDLDCIICD